MQRVSIVGKKEKGSTCSKTTKGVARGEAGAPCKGKSAGKGEAGAPCKGKSAGKGKEVEESREKRGGTYS